MIEYSKIVIMCRDGQISTKQAHEMLKGCEIQEIWEWLFLSLNPEIYYNSAPHKRLNFLTDKYETQKALEVL